MSVADEARLRELAEAARKYLAGHDIKADGYGSQVWGQSLKGGDTHIADIRGWGYLTGRGGGLALSEEDGIAAQRAVQEYLVAAWNAVPHLLDALSAERERGDRAEWRPISEHDDMANHSVILWNGEFVAAGWLNDDGYSLDTDSDSGELMNPQPTHFRSMPAPPLATQKADGHD